jgi:hypothetical protein
MCVHPDKVAALRLGGDISDRHFKMTYEHGIDDGGWRCGDDEGKSLGDSEGGGKNAGAESAPRLTGGDTTPRRRVVPITDRVTNRRVDEGDCGMARGGNEG